MKKETSRVPEEKKKLVQELASKIKKSNTVLLASCKGLPSSQFHAIKKLLRGKAEVRVAKKKAVMRAIDMTEKGALQNIKDQLTSDIALFFSDMDAFALSGLLGESQSPAKARAGDIAPEDISIEPGPTDLVPGPAISELSGVGLKVAVKEGKLEILKGAVVAKKGDAIKENVAAVLSKLNITPMRVGFIPVAAYDSVSDKVYVGITIDKEGTLDQLRDMIKKALGFAVNIKYPTEQTVRYFLAKASMEEKAIEKLVNNTAIKEGA